MDAIFSKTQGYAMLTISASWTVGLGCPSRPHKATLKTNESRPCEGAQDRRLVRSKSRRTLTGSFCSDRYRESISKSDQATGGVRIIAWQMLGMRTLFRFERLIFM